MAVYDHYRWRYSLFQDSIEFKGLTKNKELMKEYMEDTVRMGELKFWI